MPFIRDIVDWGTGVAGTPVYPPTPQPDSFSTTTDTQLTLDVLGNDTDPQGDPLIITAVEQPALGTITIAGDSLSLIWQAYPDPLPVQTVSYTVQGTTTGKTASALLSIVVYEQPVSIVLPFKETSQADREVFFIEDSTGDIQGFIEGVPSLLTDAQGAQLTDAAGDPLWAFVKYGS